MEIKAIEMTLEGELVLKRAKVLESQEDYNYLGGRRMILDDAITKTFPPQCAKSQG